MNVADLAARRLTDSLGLVPLPSWTKILPEALADLARSRGCPISKVLDLADSDPNVLRDLAGYVTIGETHFFRHPGHFAAAATFLTAARLQAPLSLLRIWSAGCASGEEAFSLAMTAKDALGSLERIEIHATDVSADAIRRASVAEYGPWSFRGVAKELADRHFRTVAHGRLAPLPALRQAIHWHHGSLLEHAARMPEASLDIIFFRNVAIYLAAPTLAAIYSAFRRALRPGGLLVVAPADPRPREGLFVRVEEDSTSVYRRPDDAAAPVQATASAPVTVAESTRTRAADRVSLRNRPTAARRSEPRKLSPPAAMTAVASVQIDGSAAGDRGDYATALGLADAMIARDPTDPAGYRAAAQIHMAEHRIGSALAQLQKALFLCPTDLITRYWYALALEAAGLHADVVRNLGTLRRALADKPDNGVLEDGETSVRELRAAVRLLAGRFE